jgi:opacity protein-like surface antigen
MGGPQPVNGQSVSFKTETSETIHFLYIPVTVRYEFGKSKLSYFVEGGGAFNLVKKDIVKVTVNDSYVEDNNFDGLNSFNYSLLLGAGVNYNFYKGLSTFLKPSFRYSITPINDNNPLYSYPYYLGVGVGFSIHF